MNLHLRGGLAAIVLSMCSLAAQAASYAGILTGPNESPANASPGLGAAVVTFDTSSHTLVVNVAFAGLTGETTASHIHCCTAVPDAGTAPVATETPTFASFPLGVHNGAYSNIFDTSLASSWNPAFITANGGTTAGAESALAAGLASGEAYLNIHTTTFGGGEIRAFLAPLAPVPEPSGWAMLGLGISAVLMVRRRRAADTA